MGLRPTQEDLLTPFRTKKLWVPHISRSEMWEDVELQSANRK